MSHPPEAFSRILIDRALADRGWVLFDPRQVRLELSGKSGRADYILFDSLLHRAFSGEL